MAADYDTFGTVYDHFSEVNEVLSLIEKLPHVIKDFRSLELSQQRFTAIMDKYQEQPHLLDPHLDNIIDKLFGLVRMEDAPPTLTQNAFKFIYLISKVRGPKVIVRWFSHEVSDLEPVLDMIHQQDPSDVNTWETRYILLLWLSIIVIIPFNLSLLDGGHSNNRTTDVILAIGKMYLNATDKSQDAAVLLCSKFLSRPDVQKLKLVEFLEWARGVLATTDANAGHSNLLCGVVKSLASLFKIAKRDEMLPHAPYVLQFVSTCNFLANDNMLLRKLYIKLIQRLGTTFLPVRVLSWRYQRGNRSLEAALKGATPTITEETKDRQVEDDDDVAVPDEIEEILGILLTGITDKDTIVRWSSAKGIGRITDRLSLQLANEVLDSLLDCFSSRDSDSAWHGGCLALAELGRRGLLLPQRLPDVVPVVLEALIYDERKGFYSVGSHVRDGACYVCWSFARAYNPDQLKPFIDIIAKGLVTVMIFDREINCRRAASAAFQENVGRQGTMPHGIHVLTLADYFAVGNISHVYLTLSVQVGQYTEYTKTLIDHLVEHKLHNWDSSIRELASQSLHNLTPLDPVYLRDKILPMVVSNVTSSDVCLRHGSVYAAAEITHSLSILAHEENLTIEGYLANDGLVKSLTDIASKLVSIDAFAGITGMIMRPAALKLIEKLSLSSLFIGSDVLDVWQSIIDDNLSHTEESIRNKAVSSLTVLCQYKYCDNSTTEIIKIQEMLLPRYQKELMSKLNFSRMGFALALGSLPKQVLKGKLDEVLGSLLASATNIQDVNTTYTEGRRDSIIAIKNICMTMDVSVDGSPSHFICQSTVDDVFGGLFVAMGDYTTDSRGDIGAVVREAAMDALEKICMRLSQSPTLIKAQHVEDMIGHLIQQSNEKIDRTRALACAKLVSLIHHQPPITGITEHSILLDIFKWDRVSELNWSVAHLSFPFTVQLLDVRPYSYRTLLGLIISVGGLTESIVRSSSNGLLKYLKQISNCQEKLSVFTDNIIAILEQHSKDSRVIIPLFKSLELMLYNGIFDFYLKDDNVSFLLLMLEKLKQEVKGSRDIVKLLASITVFCGLLQFPSIKKACLGQLMLYLGHSYPKVRRVTADQMYTTLITYDDLFTPDVIDQLMNVLSDTTWDGPLQAVREQRNSICVLLDLPILKAKEGTGKTKKSKDEMSYKDLVERMGY